MKCRGKATIFGSACSACTKVPAKVERLWELSNQSAERMNFRYQSHDQLVQANYAKTKIIDRQRLEVNN